MGDLGLPYNLNHAPLNIKGMVIFKNYSNPLLANSFGLFKTLLFIFEKSGGLQPP